MNTYQKSKHIYLHREEWFGRQISVRIFEKTVRDGVVTNAIVEMPTLRTLTQEDVGVELPPTMTLSPEDAQMFIDELWRIGIRPTEGEGSAGQLGAIKAHLEDMRTLVFNKNNSTHNTP